MDALDEPDRLARLEAHVRGRGLPFHRISAMTGDGVDALLEAVWREIARVRDAEPADPALASRNA